MRYHTFPKIQLTSFLPGGEAYTNWRHCYLKIKVKSEWVTAIISINENAFAVFIKPYAPE